MTGKVNLIGHDESGSGHSLLEVRMELLKMLTLMYSNTGVNQGEEVVRDAVKLEHYIKTGEVLV